MYTLWVNGKRNSGLQLSESITLDVVDRVKLYCITRRHWQFKKLTFSSHIARICKKAGKHYFSRRLPTVLTPESKLMLLKCYILVHFNFAQPCGTFAVCQKLKKKWKKNQEHSLRIVYNDVSSSYSYLVRFVLFVQRSHEATHETGLWLFVEYVCGRILRSF